jgi:C4-dicarboxylate-specific signal transduction histidine kinase
VPDRERIYAVGRDVTELKDAEDRLQETRQELTQVARRATMAVISAALAHEIKQPLGAMVANANASLRWLAKAPPDVDKVRTILEDIVADGHRVSDVIQSVRSIFSQSDQPGTVLDLNELIRETIGLTRGDLDSAHVVAHLELGLQLPSICAHRVQLQQVLLNIVANAVDAMRSTSGRARVLRVRSRPVEFDGVEVTVQDSGIGIEPENVDRIFHAFFTTKPSGMGMGLAICRSIVEAHGGSLSVAATVPHGSAFRIVLPSRR